MNEKKDELFIFVGGDDCFFPQDVTAWFNTSLFLFGFLNKNSVIKQLAIKFLDVDAIQNETSKHNPKTWLKLKKTTSNAKVSLK